MLCRSEIFFKTFCKTMVFFSKKNWDISNPKFQQNSIVYYFFFIFLAFFEFCFLFHLSILGQKLWNFLWCFIGRIRDFTSDFWKILKLLLRKYWYVKYFLFQNFAVYYLFFYFFIIFDIYFEFRLSSCQKILEIFRFLYFME